MTILDDIIAYKKSEVAEAKSGASLSVLQEVIRDQAAPRGFERSLRRRMSDGIALIAEIKKASPSKGLIRADFDPHALALAYAEGGATCLSVLTDNPSFQGSRDDLRVARGATSLPIIRKDFMIDPYQIVEARAWGADCILLIVACLSDAQLGELAAAADELGLDILIETHDEREIDRALAIKPGMIGINNRDLRTFTTDLGTTERLAGRIPRDRLIVAESGINAFADITRLRAAGAGAFLVGESLMRQHDVRQAAENLLNGPANA